MTPVKGKKMENIFQFQKLKKKIKTKVSCKKHPLIEKQLFVTASKKSCV